MEIDVVCFLLGFQHHLPAKNTATFVALPSPILLLLPPPRGVSGIKRCDPGVCFSLSVQGERGHVLSEGM